MVPGPGSALTIAGSEFIALLGPPGCGKSTALTCLAGLLPLSAGGIWLDNERIDGIPPEDRGFGFVFQNYALFPHMSVRGTPGRPARTSPTSWDTATCWSCRSSRTRATAEDGGSSASARSTASCR
jgi:ABC-type branched-subunit amino acid transport system ATPase component